MRGSPFNLPYADLVVAKVRARNAIAFSDYSVPNGVGALIETEPLTSAVPTPQRGAATSHLQAEVTWTAMTTSVDTGGSPIISYNL